MAPTVSKPGHLPDAAVLIVTKETDVMNAQAVTSATSVVSSSDL